MSNDAKTPTCQLYGACFDGDLSKVQELLANGADANQPNDKGFVPLMFACEADDRNIIKLLAEAGADPNHMIDDTSLLLWMTLKGNTIAACALLECGANPNIADNDGLTPLMYICSQGDKDMADALLKHGTRVNALPDFHSPLYQSFVSNHSEISLMLINAGADPNHPKDRGMPLVAACARGNPELVKALLDAGADPNVVIGEHTPLIAAIYNDHREIVEILLAAGADANGCNSAGFNAWQFCDQEMEEFMRQRM